MKILCALILITFPSKAGITPLGRERLEKDTTLRSFYLFERVIELREKILGRSY